MNSISVVIITFNEEANIGRCLESVKPIADEIIVVDSFSTDRTKEIALNSGANFHLRAWEGYSAAKNYGNGLATKEWILSIDADEALSEELQNSMINFKTSDTEFNSFEVNRLTNYCGYWVRHCGWYPDRRLRLWQKNEVSWRGDLHENTVFKGTKRTSNLKGDLLHYSFPTINHHVSRLNSYSEIAAEQLIKSNKKIIFPIHILLNPITTFIKKYFIQLGFLDGYYGFIICYISAFANFLKYSKAFHLKKSSRS